MDTIAFNSLRSGRSQHREAFGTRWRHTGVSLLLVLSAALTSCDRATQEAGPLAYQGQARSSWTGPIAVNQQRAWGLIHFGREGLRATVRSVRFTRPPPDELVTRVELNSGKQIPIGAPDRTETTDAQPVPGTISGVVQIVVWFEPRQTGIQYFSPATVITYSVDGRDYRARYPVGVGICSVERVTATTNCDLDRLSNEP